MVYIKLEYTVGNSSKCIIMMKVVTSIIILLLSLVFSLNN